MANDGWTTTTLGEMWPFKYGKGLPAAKRDDSGAVNVYGSNGVVGRHSVAVTEGPTVVVGRKGSVGAVHFSPQACWPIDTTFYVETNDEISARYIYYLLKTVGLEHMNSDSAVPGLNRDAAHARAISVPSSVMERRAIGSVLAVLDEKIELNRRMALTLEEMARALFKSWFVDFDPVRAKAEGRDPGLPKHLADLFPDRLVDSDLGEIPEGWALVPLSDLAKLTQKSINPGSQPETLWEHFSIPAFDAGRMSVAERGIQIKSGKYKVPSGCVLISKLNPSTPRVWLPDVKDEERSISSTEFLPFVPVRVEWRSFLFELLRSAPFEDAVVSRVSGSTGSRQRVLPGDVASLRFVRPNDDLIDQFSGVATCWHKRTLAATREAAELSLLRDALLPKLVSGELRLPDPEGLLARLGAVA